ncbi:MAG: 2-oxoglutarate dehydrogenase E1 component, partial [Phycisphaerales bacterium]|nr:2-oxoglutarate dehydrogenase E1 component [Phycisphaerales bacterium]
QTFHMFRRQMKRGFRKPLIVATPKSMLRVPTSRIEELTRGHFEEILDDPMFAGSSEGGGGDRSRVRQITLCCGKIYHELDARRSALGREDVALIRIEQLYPFHFELMKQVLGRYPDTAEIVYVQEEPRNMGGGMYVTDQITAFLGVDRPRYIGRPPSASPAVGSKRVHKSEQEHIITEAIGAKPIDEDG